MTETITGTNRSAGVSFSELLAHDSHPVSDLLRDESRVGVREGNTRIPAWYYTSPEFHALEVEKLWSRVWQLVCLDDEIPEVGDYHVYEIADMSFLIVRTDDGFKAYRNACLHRGRLLRETHGKGAKNLRCAFHGWAWHLDGTMKEIPCEWDFPSVRKEDYSLPEALVDTWHGFVFINPDRDAAPLADHLGELADHFDKGPFEHRYKAAHVEKIMRVNWKACQEAFMESYHVVAFPVAPDPANKPAPAPVTRLGPDDDWTMATELGAVAKIFQQDSINLPHVQRGLKAQEQQEVVFANYNETKIRHFWEMMYRWLEIGETNVSITPRA